MRPETTDHLFERYWTIAGRIVLAVLIGLIALLALVLSIVLA